jgi:hypothetical protein
MTYSGGATFTSPAAFASSTKAATYRPAAGALRTCRLAPDSRNAFAMMRALLPSRRVRRFCLRGRCRPMHFAGRRRDYDLERSCFERKSRL